jgi:hypothetical protein
MKRLLFHLVNWPDFRGPDTFTLLVGGGGRGCGRVFLKVDGWSITIVEVDGLDGFLDGLKKKTGYVITHVGEVTRENGESFSSAQAEQLLALLHCYFSFVLAITS